MNPTAGEVITGLWWIPFLFQSIPLLAFLFSQFLIKDQDYSDKVGLFINANKANHAKALKRFVVTEIDGDIEEKCLEFINESSRRFKLTAALSSYGKIYTKLASISLRLLIASSVIFIAGVVAVLLNDKAEIWALSVNTVLAISNITIIYAMRHYLVKLQSLAGNEDIST
ncbi:hypothetical protein KY385_00430 [Candidatus Parcubacteria bacterium]|nr:hypothetical protein [Candidatus Parcubacteria bacterium]